jgi:hypothetical protein
MKWLATALACLMLAAALSACGPQTPADAETEALTSAGTTPAGTDGEGLPAGYAQVSGPGEIEAQLDLFITLPERAEDATYGIVDGRYAYMTFRFEGTDYCYSAGRGKANIHEDGTDYGHREQANWLGYPYELAWNDDGAGCVQWEDALDGVCYRLTAHSGAERGALGELAVMLLPSA